MDFLKNRGAGAMRSRSVVRALSLLALAACQGYEPEPGEPVAKLRFVSYSGDMSTISMQDTSVCPERKRIIYQQISGLLPRSPTHLGMAVEPEPGARDFEELLIPAKPRTVVVVGSSRSTQQFVPGYNCNVGVSFDSRADAQYEIQYRYDGASCSARLYELQGAARVAVPGGRTFGVQQYGDHCPFAK
jgi:hypothetical protein